MFIHTKKLKMIEASSNSLGEFLKNSSVGEVAETAQVVASPVETMENASNGLETFTKLLETAEKLLNSPLISQMINKQPAPQQQPAPVNKSLPLPAPAPQINYNEKAKILIETLVASIKEMTEKDGERTVNSIYEEIQQEQVIKGLETQVKILLK